MDTNNLSGISIQDNLDESDFSEVSSVGTDLKKILEKLKKLEAKLAMNESGSPLMFQIGEKYGKLKNKVEGMEKEFGKKIAEMEGKNEELKKELAERNGKMEEKIAEKNRQIKEELEAKIDVKDRQMHEMKDEFGKMGQEMKKMADELEGKGRAMDGLKAEIGAKDREFEGKIAGLKEENAKLRRELGEKLEQKAEKEEFANLGQRVNGLETHFKFEGIKLDGNNFGTDSGTKLAISEGGRIVKHSGPTGCNSVRAQMAFPKFNLIANKPSIAYFEVEILVKTHPNWWNIHIGFCTLQFSLEGNLLGNVQNSIGIWNKGGIYIDGKDVNFGNNSGQFQQGEVIGIGIAHYPDILSMKCFATCNGNLLRMFDLPIKFADLQLYPAVSMYWANDSIRANFGTEGFRYNPREMLQNL